MKQSQPNLVLSPSYIEIGYVKAGYGTLKNENYNLSLQTGNIYFFPTFVPCIYENMSSSNTTKSSQLKLIRFLYSTEGISMATPLIPMKWMVEKQQHQEQFQQLFACMRNNYNLHSGIVPAEFMTLLLELLVESNKSKLLSSVEDITSSTDKAFYAIGNQFMYKLSLSQASRFAAMSTRNFQRTVKSLTDRTFVQLLQEIRIRHSCGLLQFTQYSVQNIAQMVGISDMNYFYRIFRDYCGMTPATYRCTHQLSY